MALGSGFIIDPSGYVVTNNHVVGDASKVTVTLKDDTKYTAKIIGRDPKTDLALLKINRNCHNVLSFTRRRQPQGTEVYLCGYPGTVVMTLNADAMTPDKINERRQKWSTFESGEPMGFTYSLVSTTDITGGGGLGVDVTTTPSTSACTTTCRTWPFPSHRCRHPRSWRRASPSRGRCPTSTGGPTSPTPLPWPRRCSSSRNQPIAC